MIKKLLFVLLVSASVNCQTAGTIDSAESKLYFRTFGSGDPILIINGGPGMNSNGFAALAETLSKNNTTIIYDQRGTGKSTVEPIASSTITMALLVSDIENLRKHLKIEKWTILGHSFGGMLASYYATKHPENITSLIMSSSGGVDLGLLSNGSLITNNLNQSERDSLDYWERKIRNGDKSFKPKMGRGRAMAPAYVFNPANRPLIAQRLTESNLIINGLVWQDMQRIKFDCSPKLEAFDKKVLIIQGKDDILPVRIAEKMHLVFKNSTLVLLERCAHYGWLDRPDQYFPEIDKFLKTI